MKVSEVYQSIQGEGPRVGCPTTFVRFAGCNLRCPSWPCDTPHAIFPEKFRKEWEKVTVNQLLERVPDWPRNVCLTGGEPTIQNHESLHQFVLGLEERGHCVEMFSNGTVLYPEWLLDKVFVVMDWKLPGSGENPDDPIRLDNQSQLSYCDAIKFTIADWVDFIAAKQRFEDVIGIGDDAPMIFAGVVWEKLDEGELAEWILEHKLPWRLNVQVHNFIWDRTERGI